MANHLLFAMLCLIWGTTWLAIKVGLDDLPPFFSAALRFVVASTILAAVQRWKIPASTGETKPSHRFYFLMSFIWITFPYGLVYWGEQYVSSGLCAILFATMPFWVAILAHFWIPGEGINPGKMAGLLIGFLGLFLIFYDTADSQQGGALPGIVALLLSPLFAAIANVIAKRRIASLHPVTTNLWMMMYGAICLFSISLILERGEPIVFSRAAIFSLSYLGVIGSALAFVVYIHLLRDETALKMSLIVYVTPVIALLAGWLVRDEVITMEIITGSVLVFLGIYIVTMKSKLRD